ncbi:MULTISPECIES: LCP family protein [Streptomyces]|uniref:LCP family protein n=1 Tax=Streptomyces TaxID=1883 RepID=UPI0022494424|nr:LCP family protein [Streptomyces sp. JHD 1]MCX2969891.1 LytR C-terminal domain-containing protein [Streptomyces sp. JHD 1]
MNDRQDPYGHGRFVGYDEYGRPVYHDAYATGEAAPTSYAAGPYAAPGAPAPDPAQQGYPPPGQGDGRDGSADAYGHQGYVQDYGQGYGQGYGGGYEQAYQQGHGQGYVQEYGQGYGQGYQQAYQQPPTDGYATGLEPPPPSGATEWPPQQPGATEEFGAYGAQGGYRQPLPEPRSVGQPESYAPRSGYPAPAAPDPAGPGEPPASGTAPGAWPGPQPAPDREPVPQPVPGPSDPAPGEGRARRRQARRAGTPDPDEDPEHRPEYQTEEFSFIEEENEESEDVIDWLKFSESRSERREEAKRRGRNRTVALVVAAVLVLVGGAGYLWATGGLPGVGGEEAGPAAGPAEERDVVVVHLRDIDTEEISTALLVGDESAGRGTTVLLPNALALTADDGTTTTLGESFDGQGVGATRDALGNLLGADLKGTWRLDTPYLENLVEAVGGVTLEADTTVPAAQEGDPPLVQEGPERELNGVAAVAYATHRGEDEPQTGQLSRFGQVMDAVLREVSTDPATATATVESLLQVLDPSLSEAQLGAALADLARYADQGKLDTRLLPVEENGTLSDETARGLVQEVLGGTVRNSDPDAAVRVSVRDATGEPGAGESAQVTLVNGGYTVVPTREAEETVATSAVTYADEADAAEAEQVAATLGLPADAVRQDKGAANADVTVVLGADYPR